jgi:hypothetical protein
MTLLRKGSRARKGGTLPLWITARAVVAVLRVAAAQPVVAVLRVVAVQPVVGVRGSAL